MIEFEEVTGLDDYYRLGVGLYREKHGNVIPTVIYDYLNVDEGKFLEVVNKHFKVFEVLKKGYILDSNKEYINETNYLEGSDLILSYKIYVSEGKKLTKSVTQIALFYSCYLHEKVVALFKDLVNLKKKEKKISKISTVVRNNNGFYLKTFEVKKPKLSLSDNYEDIDDLHGVILKRLNTKNDKGIALFYGEPGCGKTNYIRYLLTKIKKTVIYLPPDMAHMISSPDFMPFLMDYPNSVLVIEDAENIIKSRKGGGTQSIANLLNLGDGLLSDILNIQIIATFNCRFDEIDEALVRKGRLIAKHEFKKLPKEKAQKLSDKLGFTTVIEEAMPLCDIYNQDQKSFKDKKKSIGFGITNG